LGHTRNGKSIINKQTKKQKENALTQKERKKIKYLIEETFSIKIAFFGTFIYKNYNFL